MPDGSVILVEMFGPRITRVQPDGSKETVAEIVGGPNGAAIGPDGALYLCNNGGCFTPVESRRPAVPRPVRPGHYIGGRIQRVDLATGAVTDLYTECDGRPLRAPNDLVFDAHGGFWFTDHGIRDHHTRTSDLTGIYYAKADGSHISEQVFPVEAPNGIGLSPDGNTVYWAETQTGRVLRRTIASPGVLAPAMPLDTTTCLAGLPGYQLLDSLAVDGEGNVCVATLINGGITVISPMTAAPRTSPPAICSPPTSASATATAAASTATPTSRSAAPASCCTCAGPPTDCASTTSEPGSLMAQRFYVETLGCPKNQVDSDKLIGTLLADGMTARPTIRRSSRPRGGQHLCVHRRGAQGERSTRSSPSRTSARTAAAWWSPAAWPSATATSWPRRCPRSTRSPASVCRSTCWPRSPGPGKKSIAVSAAPHPHARPAQPAAAEVVQPVGLREDRRGLRPQRAGSAPSRRSAARSAAATSSSILDEVDQLEAQEIVLVAQDLASYGKDRPDELGAGRSCRWCARSAPKAAGCACCTCTPATSPTS
jgi:gluconolactonase